MRIHKDHQAAAAAFGVTAGASLLNEGNAKTIKGEKKGWRTYGMHLAPFNLSGHQTCACASVGCAAACLNTAGRGIQANVQEARKAKTRWLFGHRESFLAQLRMEIAAAVRRASKTSLQPCFRLNLTSDIPWEREAFGAIPQAFPELQFYDYTKVASRALRATTGDLVASGNYALTFSRAEDNNASVAKIMDAGGNVAAVFRGSLPAKWRKVQVIDGDESDLRFLDPSPCIVGLVEKGMAKRDETGFVIG